MRGFKIQDSRFGESEWKVDLKTTRFYQDTFAEGEAAMLLRLLERKFHPLPESTRQRVAAADTETLLV